MCHAYKVQDRVGSQISCSGGQAAQSVPEDRRRLSGHDAADQDGPRGKHSMGAKIVHSRALAALSVALLVIPALAGKKDDTLNIAWDQPLDIADAYFNTSREGILAARMIWDQLIERDPDTFEYKASLATAWRWVDDRTLEFDLRRGVTFHNAQPFDADDVVYTFNFASDPANTRLQLRNVSSIRSGKKTAPLKVRIHLKRNFPAALEYVAGPMPIYPHIYYAEVGPQGMARKPIGTGPYMVESLEPGKSIVFVKNTKYWDG